MVFPTRVGMNRYAFRICDMYGVPHSRGDEPLRIDRMLGSA